MYSYFWSIFTPSPCHTLSHFFTHPGTPQEYVTHLGPPIFSRPCTKTRTKAPCTNSFSIARRGFCPGGLCQRGLCLEGFVRGSFYPFPLLSEYICYNRKLNIALNVMFHMYNNFFISGVTSHALDFPLPCHKL